MPKSQNPAAPAAGRRRTAGISSHAVSSAPPAHSALTASPPGPGALPLLGALPHSHSAPLPSQGAGRAGTGRSSQDPREEQTKRARLLDR